MAKSAPRDWIFRWVWHQGDNRLFDVGILADGTLHNPRGYPGDVVARRHGRKSCAARKAAETRSRRRSNRIRSIAKRLVDDNGAPIGPRNFCIICGRGLSDRQSIDRGIGSECWQDVLEAIELQTSAETTP